MAAGMTLGQLSAKCGISLSQLSRMEIGRDDWTAEKFEAVRIALEGGVGA